MRNRFCFKECWFCQFAESNILMLLGVDAKEAIAALGNLRKHLMQWF